MRLFVAKWYLNISRILHLVGEFADSPFGISSGGIECAGFGEMEMGSGDVDAVLARFPPSRE
jgi:hypothetical protein